MAGATRVAGYTGITRASTREVKAGGARSSRAVGVVASSIYQPTPPGALHPLNLSSSSRLMSGAMPFLTPRRV